MLVPVHALLARMKYITRWSLMHSTRAEFSASTPAIPPCWPTCFA